MMSKKDKEYVLVKTISTFEHSYIIPLNDDMRVEDHLDYVTCNEVEETSQLFLDETILMNSTRLLSEDEAIELFDRENDYLRGWSLEKKREHLNNRVKESYR